MLEFAQGESRNQANAEFEPIEFYKRFINNGLLDKIVDESNKYAIQTNPSIPLNIEQKWTRTVFWYSLCNELGKNAKYQIILVYWT